MRDIIDETGQSRSTVHRAVNELLNLGLVHRVDDGIEATLTGRLARDQLTAYLHGLDDILTARAVLEPLPSSTDIEYDIFRGAETIVAAHPAPYRPSDRMYEEMNEATAYRALLPTLGDSRMVRVLYEHVVTRGNPVELVVSEDVFRTLQNEFPRRMALLAETDNFTVFVGDTPPYALDVLDHDVDSTTVHLVVHNDNGGVHGVVVNETAATVSWATTEYKRYRQKASDRTAELIADSDGGVQASVNDASPVRGQSLPVTLEREGFVRVDPTYFQNNRVASPQTAWRAGLSLTEVHTGYAIERPGTAEEGEQADDRTLAVDLTTALAEGSNCLLVGQPGSGKSTVCKQVACDWYDAGRGTVLYRDGARGQAFRSVDDLITTAASEEGHTLVVVEDAIRPDATAIFDALEELTDSGVSVLLDAREYEWSAYSEHSADLLNLDVVHVPPMQPEDCERLVSHFEQTVGKPVDVPVDQLWSAVHDEAAAGDTPNEMLRLIHRLSTYAAPVEDSPTALEKAVESVYSDIADDETTLSVALMANTLNIAGIGGNIGLLYAVSPNDEFEAVDRSLARLEGQILFLENDGSYRTVHEEWSVAFLVHFLETVGTETASEQFGTVVTELLALADDAERREQISSYVGNTLPIDDPKAWADDTAKTVFARAKKQSNLALLFGDGGDDSIELPERCSEAVVANVPVWLGQIFLAGAYYDRAERAFERVSPDEGERTVERLLGLARVCTERSEYDEAATYFEECLSALKGWDSVGDPSPVARARVRVQYGEALASYNQYADAETQFESALDELSTLDHPGLTATVRSGLGNVAVKQGEHERARENYEAALELRRELGDRRAEADILNSFGSVPWVQGTDDEARKLFEQALDLRETIGDRHGQAKTLYNVGLITKRQTQYELAEEYFERSLEILETIGDEHTAVQVQGALALNLIKQGKYDRAQSLLEQWLDHSRELGDRHDEARALNNLALLARRRGEYDQANSMFEQSLEHKEEIGDSRGAARTVNNLGQVATLQGRFGRATALFEESIERKDQFESNTEVANSTNCLGVVAVREGKIQRAAEYFARGLEHAQTANEPNQEAVAHHGLTEVAMQRGAYERASEHLEDGARAVAGEETTLDAQRQLIRARLAHAREEFDNARSHTEAALQEFEQLNSKHWIGRANRLLGRIDASTGDVELARERLDTALTIFEEIEAYHDAAETLEHLVETCFENDDPSAVRRWHERATELLDDAPEATVALHQEWANETYERLSGQ